MNKEKVVCLLAAGLMVLAIALTAAGWPKVKTFKPPVGSRSQGAAVETPTVEIYFADEDDVVAFPDGARNLFQPMLETVDLPPAKLPAPPLPKAERVAPPPFPAPGYGDLSSLAEPAPEVKPAGAGGDGGEEGTGEEDE